MKLLVAEVSNFGSYRNLTINFNDRGLTLVSGPTGAGKSTLQDIPVWILYGVTAKNGNADEVRNWSAPTEVTKGQISVDLSGCIVSITRIRGKQGQNDLWWEDSEGVHRGKDLLDTQKLLNGVLGVSEEEYVISSYYNEFSPIRSFFYAKAKERRALLDKLADLSFPITLNEKLINAKKERRKIVSEKTQELNQARGRRDQLGRSKEDCQISIRSWEKSQEEAIQILKNKIANKDKEKESIKESIKNRYDFFEANRTKKIQELKDKIEDNDKKIAKIASAACILCGSMPEIAVRLQAQTESLLEALEDKIDSPNLYEGDLARVDAFESHYEEQLKSELSRENPHQSVFYKLEQDFARALIKETRLTNSLEGDKIVLEALDQLSELSSVMRSEILKDNVSLVQEETNSLLETHFDAVLRLELEVTEEDSLALTILKDGHECSFTQLSKGQRCILQLCFSAAVMSAASNKSATHFDSLFFDESLDGLDGELKLRAYDLFLSLESRHSSIFVIEHSEELKSLFTSKISVKLIGEESVLEE